jgi:hypothetical protein
MNTIPHQLFILENHTEIKENVKIFDLRSEQKLDDWLNGITQISFKMNYTEIETRPFVFFANFEGSLTSSNFSTFPKHTSRSEVAIYFNFLKKTTEYDLICEKYFSLSARIIARNWIGYISVTFISILIIILFILFRNDQPLKSRFFSPVLMILTISVNLFSEHLYGTLEYEANIKIFCTIDGFIGYPSVQLAGLISSLMIFRYAILLQFRLRKREFIKNWISLKNSKSRSNSVFVDKIQYQIEKTRENQHFIRFFQTIRKIFLFLQSRWILIFVPIVWISIFILVMFAIYSYSGFTCLSWTFQYMRYVHFFGLLLCTICILFFYLLDVVMSFRNFLKCECHRFWVEDDPSHARMEYGILFIFVPLVIIWGVGDPVPYFFRSILSDVLFFLGFLMGGGIALFITIFKKFIFFLQSRKLKETRTKITFSLILKDEILLDKFIQFTEYEWSSENVYFKLDVLEYQKKTDLVSKRNLALQMKKNYLLVNVSPLELNVTRTTLNAVLRKMEENEFEDDLFEKLVHEVDTNLYDTLSRFEFSNIYLLWMKSNETELSTLVL